MEISVTLAKSEEDEQQDDLPMVATWLTKMDENYEAQLTYIFDLQDIKKDEYIDAVKDAGDHNEIWEIIEKSLFDTMFTLFGQVTCHIQ